MNYLTNEGITQTWYTLCKYPNRFAAAVPIAGGGDTTALASFINIPLWAFHGTNDTIVPVAGSRSMIRAFTRFGGMPKFTEYSTTQINQNGYDHYGDHIYYLPFPLEPTLKEWIFSKSKATSMTNKKNGNQVAVLSKKAKKDLSLTAGRSVQLKIWFKNTDGEPAMGFDIRGIRIY
jgi:hypothetical protein